MFGFHSKDKDRASAEAIIKDIHSYYEKAKVMYPKKKEILYLAIVWAVFAKKRQGSQYQDKQVANLIVPGGSESIMFSFLKPPGGIDALSLFMVHKERLSVSKEYEPRFKEIMGQLQVTEEQVNEAPKEMVEYFADQLEALQDISEDSF